MSQKMIVLISEPIHPDGTEILKAKLGDRVEVVTLPTLTREGLVEAIREADALIVRIAKVDASLLEGAKKLRVIGKHGIGVDNIDIDAATAKRIPVVFTPGTNDEAVAEHTLMMMIMLAKRCDRTRREMMAGRFSQIRALAPGQDIFGRTLGLVGVGRIGSRVGEICRLSFGMKVLAFDPYITPERAKAIGAEKVESLGELLESSEFVSVHTPLTPETKRLIGSAELARMPEGAFIINCARGGIIDEAALLQSLESGHLGGAGLDAYAAEPPDISSPLFARDDVIATPHTAGGTADAMRNIARLVAEEVALVLCDEKPRYVVNAKALG